jgi:hypothetical protein
MTSIRGIFQLCLLLTLLVSQDEISGNEVIIEH